MNPKTQPTRVLLADDHPLIRTGIRAALSNEPDILLVGEASDGNEVLARCAGSTVDVLILDLSMPGPHPKDTVARLKEISPNTQVLVLTAFDDDIYIKTLISLGIKGYILKDEATDILVGAIRTVALGGNWFSPRAFARITQLMSGPSVNAEKKPALTDREIEILSLLKSGNTNKEIAFQLGLTERTIRFHTENIIQKLKVKTRIEALAYAIEQGWVKD